MNLPDTRQPSTRHNRGYAERITARASTAWRWPFRRSPRPGSVARLRIQVETGGPDQAAGLDQTGMVLVHKLRKVFVRPSAYFDTAIRASNASVGRPLSMHAGRAWINMPSSSNSSYLGWRGGHHHNFAGMTSSRSDTSSPISTFCLPARSGRSSGSITTSTRSRWGGKALRGRGERSDASLDPALADLRLQGGDAGFDLLEDEGLLRVRVI